MEIRSFRAVFELERRVYRVDTVRLNPAGIPVRGILYAAVLVPICVIAGRLPPLAWIIDFAPWYVRDLGLPVIGAALATIIRIDGRPFHHAARALAIQWAAPRHLCALARAPAPGSRWRPGPVLLIPDGSDARFRRLRYRGPGAILVGYPHDRAEWPSSRLRAWRRTADLTLLAHDSRRPLARPAVLDLAAGAVLEVVPFGACSSPSVLGRDSGRPD